MAKMGEAAPAPKVDAPKAEPAKAPEAAAPAAAPAKAPAEVSKVSAMVDVLPAENFKCKHGKKWYSFEKGKKMAVPRDMYEDCLKGAGKLQMTV